MTDTRYHNDTAISPAALRERLAQSADVVMLDVRSAGEFGAGHIPGALNVPLDQLRGYTARITAADRALVLVCQSGARSETARRRLAEAGATSGRVLTGGMGA